MKPLAFALAFHNHQPVGNSDAIIERIYQKSYLPFLKTLSAHPDIKANLHYTGFLLDWLEANHPELILLLEGLVRREQVELLGGAFYEPILSVIPDSDAQGQIDLLSRKIRSLFGIFPRGIWVAERAWEPNLPELLEKSKIEFTMLDDTIFQSTGLSPSACFAPYNVESRASSVCVIPIQKYLRYSMPFKAVAATISFLRKTHDDGEELALFADDGEKFGAWPTTFERVFKERWLDELFRAVEREQINGTLTTVKLSDYLSLNRTRQETHLPSAAYPELMEWSLSLSDDKKAVHHGFFRLFLSKYPESARLYSKMLWTSKLVHSARNRDAMIELWKGQCNDAYWHGVFGGLYAPLLRKTTFEHLIRAQAISEKSLHRGNWISCEKFGSQIMVNTRNFCVTISPAHGGSMTGLDFKPRFSNICDTLARRPERYHEELNKKTKNSKKKVVRSIHETPTATERGLEKLLSYDKYEKSSFLDLLVDSKTDQNSFSRQDFKEATRFAGEEYKSKTIRSPNQVEVTLVRTAQRTPDLISIQKTYEIISDSSKITVHYSITSSGFLSCKFVPELNLGCLADSGFVNEYGKPNMVSSKRIEISYPETRLSAIVSAPSSREISTIPIWTVSQSERGFEKNLQGISVLPFHEIDLGKKEEFQTELSIELKSNR